MIGWPVPPAREGTCGGSARLGMIDTGINEDHENFEVRGWRSSVSARPDVDRLARPAWHSGRGAAGSAIRFIPLARAALGARLFAQDAFHRRGDDERADVFTLVIALGRQAEEQVQVSTSAWRGQTTRCWRR